jgi:YHS domain-containing protein
MNKFLIAFIVVIGLAFAFAQDKPNKEKKEAAKKEVVKDSIEVVSENELTIWNERCPIMGGKIDPEANTVEYDGKLYGFCCNGCDKKFSKDPVKYSANLSEDGKKFVGKKEKH